MALAFPDSPGEKEYGRPARSIILRLQQSGNDLLVRLRAYV